MLSNGVKDLRIVGFFCLVFGVLKFLHSSPPDEIFLDFTGQASSNPQKHCAPPCSFTPLRYVKRQGDVAIRDFPVGDCAVAATGGSVLKFGSPSLKFRRLKMKYTFPIHHLFSFILIYESIYLFLLSSKISSIVISIPVS